MKKLTSFLPGIFLLTNFVSAQNVGIGTTSPIEKLHVNGNINMTGNLRVNGVAGQSGQALTTNANGNTQWSNLVSPDPCQYKNFATLVLPGQWIVPAGTTRVLIHAWGGGGGGNTYGGGGGGGFVAAHFGVRPGNTVTIVEFGVGGTGTTTGNAGMGGSTTVNVLDSFNTVYAVYATGGGGAYTNGTVTNVGYGGGYTINPGYYNLTGLRGQPGFPNTYDYVEKTAGVFSEIVLGGMGGDAANTTRTGGVAGNFVTGGRSALPSAGILPGGGGGASGNTSAAGGNGAYGYVIIWY